MKEETKATQELLDEAPGIVASREVGGEREGGSAAGGEGRAVRKRHGVGVAAAGIEEEAGHRRRTRQGRGNGVCRRRCGESAEVGRGPGGGGGVRLGTGVYRSVAGRPVRIISSRDGDLKLLEKRRGTMRGRQEKAEQRGEAQAGAIGGGEEVIGARTGRRGRWGCWDQLLQQCADGDRGGDRKKNWRAVAGGWRSRGGRSRSGEQAV